MLARPFGRRRGLAEPVRDSVRVHDQPPGPCQARVVAGLLEHRDCALRLLEQCRRPPVEPLGVPAVLKEDKRRLRAEPLLPDLGRDTNRFGQEELRPGELADVDQRLAQVGEQVEPSLVEAPGRAPPRGGAGSPRRACRRGRTPVAGGPQPRRRLPPTARPWSSSGPELGEVGVRLLEVVAEDLLVLIGAVAVHLVGPRHEALVQLGAHPLQQPVVGRVADQDVLEACTPRRRS